MGASRAASHLTFHSCNHGDTNASTDCIWIIYWLDSCPQLFSSSRIINSSVAPASEWMLLQYGEQNSKCTNILAGGGIQAYSAQPVLLTLTDNWLIPEPCCSPGEQLAFYFPTWHLLAVENIGCHRYWLWKPLASKVSAKSGSSCNSHLLRTPRTVVMWYRRTWFSGHDRDELELNLVILEVFLSLNDSKTLPGELSYCQME